MGLWNLIVRFFQGGGDFMYPIAIVFVVGLPSPSNATSI